MISGAVKVNLLKFTYIGSEVCSTTSNPFKISLRKVVKHIQTIHEQLPRKLCASKQICRECQ